MNGENLRGATRAEPAGLVGSRRDAVAVQRCAARAEGPGACSASERSGSQRERVGNPPRPAVLLRGPPGEAGEAWVSGCGNLQARGTRWRPGCAGGKATASPSPRSASPLVALETRMPPPCPGPRGQPTSTARGRPAGLQCSLLPFHPLLPFLNYLRARVIFLKQGMLQEIFHILQYIRQENGIN